MGRVISISEEAYRALSALAGKQGSTVEALIEAWAAQQAKAEAERDPFTNPRYQTFEEFFLGLGMTKEEIQEAQAAARADDADVR